MLIGLTDVDHNDNEFSVMAYFIIIFKPSSFSCNTY